MILSLYEFGEDAPDTMLYLTHPVLPIFYGLASVHSQSTGEFGFGEGHDDDALPTRGTNWDDVIYIELVWGDEDCLFRLERLVIDV
jgi:hypothetical protein